MSPGGRQARGADLVAGLGRWLETVRGRSAALDRVAGAVQRYLDSGATLLAAAVTYYAFLALFPLVALALGVLAVLGLTVPSLDSSLLGLADKVAPHAQAHRLLGSAGVVAGVAGLVVSVYAGVRLVGALRRALAVVAGVDPRSTRFPLSVLRDLLVLVLLGGCLLASVAFGVATAVLTHLIKTDFGGSGPSAVLIRGGTILAALLTDWLVFLALTRALPPLALGWRRLAVSAAVGAVGFEVLKQVATEVIASASRNVVYGALATTVGLLVWLAFVSRWTLLWAAWMCEGAAVTARGAAAGGSEVPAP